jgi:hypothetical protein
MIKFFYTTGLYFYFPKFVNNLNMFNNKGRFHHCGKSLSGELKGKIINYVLEAGGDSTTRYSGA